MNVYAIAALLLTALLGLGGVALWIFAPGIPRADAPSFEAEIRLRNTCDIGDDYFVVRVVGTGRTARFRSGIATLRLTQSDSLRLEIAPGFPEVSYTGYDEPARARVELVADCTSTERQQMINRAMRESFGR